MATFGTSNWNQQYGEWAIVTGASDGLGQAIAQELAGAGINLVLVARRRAVLAAFANQLQIQHSIQTQVIAADLSDESAVEMVIGTTENLKVGLLVASAGFGTTGYFVESDLAQELAMLDVNCRAVVQMTHHFGERFAQQKRGGIILFSSIVAFQGVPRSAHYAATKAFIQSFAEGIAVELAPHGVDVLATAPGPINSGFAARANMQMGQALSAETVAKGTLKALGKRTTVRPGVLSIVLSSSLSMLPRWGRVRAMTQVMKGMTAHQNS